MKVIAFVNNKGGVGKTLASQLLAEYLAKIEKKKVLGIDFDPQCNFSSRYLPMEVDPSAKEGNMPPVHPDYDPNDPEEDPLWDGRSSIADIFYGKGVVPYPTFLANLDLAPGHAEKLLSAEAVRKSEVVEKVHEQLRKFIDQPDVQEAYDTIIIDTAPSKGPLTVSVIKAATHIVIPSVMEPQPIQGIYGMLQLWIQENYRRDKSNPLRLIGIMPNKFKGNTTLHQDMLSSLRGDDAIGKFVMPLLVSERIGFAEVDTANANPKSIFDHPSSHAARKEAFQACQYITERVFA